MDAFLGSALGAPWAFGELQPRVYARPPVPLGLLRTAAVTVVRSLAATHSVLSVASSCQVLAWRHTLNRWIPHMPDITYWQHDNLIDWVLQTQAPDGIPQLHGADEFTRFVLHAGAIVLDSQVLQLGAGQVFDNTVDATVGRDTVKRLLIRLGDTSLPPGTYTARLVAYSAAYPNGLVWADGIEIEHKR